VAVAAADSQPAQHVFRGGDKHVAFLLGMTLNEVEARRNESHVATIPKPDFPMPPQLQSPTEAPTNESPRAFSPFAGMELDEVDDLMGAPDDTLYELFSNGFNTTLEATGRLFRLRVETPKRHAEFIESSEWRPSTALSALPFIWAHRRHGHPHHFNDLYMANTIVAKELGFMLAYELARNMVNPPSNTESWRNHSSAMLPHTEVRNCLRIFMLWWSVCMKFLKQKQ